jgi:hypothetical protein
MNEMIENSYQHIMSQIIPQDNKFGYVGTLYGEDIDINNIKMAIVLAYNLGKQQGIEAKQKDWNHYNELVKG